MDRFVPAPSVDAWLKSRLCSEEVRLHAQVDPLRRLIRRHNDGLDRLLGRLRQMESLQRPNSVTHS